MMCLRRADKIR